MLKQRDITSLIKLEGNPRIIKDRQFESLCKSIKDNPDYFEARPLILSNRTGELVIIAGNQRYEAAKHLNLKKVPTYLIEGLTEEREREIIIRDNVNNGEWDHDILANEWDIDELLEWGVQLPVFGEKIDENDLTADYKENKPSIKITLVTIEDLKSIEVDITEIIKKYEGAFYSVSAGEL